ncbi:LytR family transcriptional regulator [Streptococcus chenjunshii]|uniref:LytR family transcriptional regulator n=1 Tax=Streptococcus chenjunshii TaxID=2173853 RepID=A0A372KPM6_9STRE|nr:LCP family protein [Streptococcus chenjunshii]AXQ79727.1 LytR family transcriptional regulator [Streptococcus chenjunshii]RFU52011.1 LytR family transcriptional regulator [Streptococcus chenjunshii]RFU54203.1 LytR family transcriptional regulator [Streptococcus chenjunshii]
MASRSGKRKVSKPSNSIWTVINFILLALYTLLSGMVIFTMFSHNFLAFRHINIILTAGLLLVLLAGLALAVLKKGKLLTSLGLVLFSLLSAGILYGFKSAIDVAGNLNDSASYSEIKMSVLVPAESGVTDVGELNELEAPAESDGSNIAALLAQIKAEKGLDLQTVNVASYPEAYEHLRDGSSQAMVMNSSYSSLLELTDDNYQANVKEIYSYTIKTKLKDDRAKSADSDVFNIYISGIDTYGSISTVSRSDVNIILTVNMKTHQILMTTTPRDAYVQIPNGGANQYDKLTHAGIYGVETSMQTLENLYGIDIDYYARINFTTFMNLVDAVGGITVYNDQAFTSHTDSEYTFEEGNVTLDSKKALAFVRERYGLDGGDNDRGKNQMKVVSAILNKLTALNSLSGYSAVITSLQDSVQTNMSLDTMMNLANSQLDSGSRFTVSQQEVTGTGSTGQLTSYAMPSASLYMLELDQSSVDKASEAIKDVISGE